MGTDRSGGCRSGHLLGLRAVLDFEPNHPRAACRVMRFWLDRGGEGYGVDMIDYLLTDPALRGDELAVTGRF